MPLLRGHHLICLHFFNGDGYDEDFINNLRHVLSSADGEEVTVTSGADDVCTRCLYLREGACRQADNADRVIQQMDEKALELLGIFIGSRARWDTLGGEVQKVFPQWFALYCRGCEWRGACEKNPLFRRQLETP